jgi:maleylpyruvate isomerase
MSIVLHGYWRSSASYRVRIALNLKRLCYEQVTHDLRRGEHDGPLYRAIAANGLVPAIEVEGQPLTQSPAILEWLEESYPTPPLLPHDPMQRALVRSMALIIACDIHPLNNLRVLKALRSDFAASEQAVQAWVGRWMGEGFAALERLVVEHGKGFCFADSPTIADCCLIPQIYNARRFAVDLSAYPALVAIDERCKAIDAFVRAAPEVQPDADGAAS